MTITEAMDPWSVPEAVHAAELAVTHQQAVHLRAAVKSVRSADRVLAWQEARDEHQGETGWAVDVLGFGRLRFYYTDPATRHEGGRTLTWTTGEEQ